MLHLHGPLRRQQYVIAVDRGLETHAFFRELAHVCQREDLEATRIRQDRPVPVHEFVQPAVLSNDSRARSQQQMKGIAENDFCAVSSNLLRRHALHRAVGSDGHERRRPDRAATERQETGACCPVAVEDFELHVSIPGVTNIESP